MDNAVVHCRRGTGKGRGQSGLEGSAGRVNVSRGNLLVNALEAFSQEPLFASRSKTSAVTVIIAIVIIAIFIIVIISIVIMILTSIVTSYI